MASPTGGFDIADFRKTLVTFILVCIAIGIDSSLAYALEHIADLKLIPEVQLILVAFITAFLKGLQRWRTDNLKVPTFLASDQEVIEGRRAR